MVLIAPDGLRAATASDVGAMRLWDIESGESRPLAGHRTTVLAAAFSPDGRALVAAALDGTARRFSDDLPSDPDRLRAWMEAATPETTDISNSTELGR